MAIKRTMLAAALVGGVSALVASKATDKICGIICIEGVNKCGQPFGGCYDPCIKSPPVPPPCELPFSTTYYPTPVPTLAPGEISNCSTITVCVDGINSCGIPFGGCIPDCKPWNIVTPPCPAEPTDIVPWIPETPEIFPPGPAIPTSSTEAPEPVSVPVPTAVPEPTAVPGPTVIPEPTTVPEPAAVPEPTTVPEPAAVPEPTVVPEPFAVPEPIAVPQEIEVSDGTDTLENVVPWDIEGTQWW